MQFGARLKGRLVKEMNRFVLFREMKREFQNDPNFRPELVAQGFLDRSEKNVDDSAILKRIVASYSKAKIAQQSAAPYYQVSNEWLPIYNDQLRGVMKALAEGNIDELAPMYRNFFRDPCSAGLIGLPVNMEKTYLRGKIKKIDKFAFLYDVISRYKLWRDLTAGKYGTVSLASNAIGNPYGFELDGVFVSAGSDYLHYYATELDRLACAVEPPVVVELGGGFGGMAYFLLRDSPKTTYVDFDLPENMALTAYYLLRAFPAMSVVLYGEEELSGDTLRNNRIVLMPNFEIEKLPDDSAGVVFNSYSLAEMSAQAIDEYIKQMTRISSRNLLHVNHTRNSLVKADEFGIERYGFELVYRKPALWNRGRMHVVDEYEFLYSKPH
jgi:putative sugar O-methyltransferase